LLPTASQETPPACGGGFESGNDLGEVRRLDGHIGVRGWRATDVHRLVGGMLWLIGDQLFGASWKSVF
jgi:hypothetical protein